MKTFPPCTSFCFQHAKTHFSCINYVFDYLQFEHGRLLTMAIPLIRHSLAGPLSGFKKDHAYKNH